MANIGCTGSAPPPTRPTRWVFPTPTICFTGPKRQTRRSFRAAVAIFDRNDPRKLLSRSDAPIFAPEKEWEKVGQVPNVVFIEGFFQHRNRFFFYYGAADKYIGVAEARAR